MRHPSLPPTRLLSCALFVTLAALATLAACSDDASPDPTPGDDAAHADGGTTDAPACADGACGCHDTCPASGDDRCADDAVETCDDHDGDGCLEWGGASSCQGASVCDEGACREECTDACPDNSASRCADGGESVEYCGDFDDDPCLEWGQTTGCETGEHCEQGACVEACSDACDSSGDRRCHEGGAQSCEDHDEDGCLEWTEATACEEREECRDGTCRLPGGATRWAMKFAGSRDRGTRLNDAAVGPSGALYTTGRYGGRIYFDGTEYEVGESDDADAFIAKYDASGDFQWVHTFGGEDEYVPDQGTGIVVDSSGTIFATGFIDGEVTVDGQTWSTTGDDRDMYLFELAPSGDLQATHTYDGVRPRALAIDDNDDLYVTGTHSTDLAELELDRPYYGDLVVVKLDDGGNLVWSRHTDGYSSGREIGRDIAVDAAGRVAVAGTYDDDFELADDVSFSYGGEDDLFLLALDAAGQTRWTSSISTPGNDRGRAVGIDSDGDVYLGGEYGGSATLAGTTIEADGDWRNLVVAKWSTDGEAQWVHGYGSADDSDNLHALTVGPNDHIYVGGDFSTQLDFGDGHTTPAADGIDSFTASYRPDGSVRWLRPIAGHGSRQTYVLLRSTDKLIAGGSIFTPTDFGPVTLDPAPYTWTNFLVEMVP